MERGLRGWRRAARSGPRTLPSNVSHRVIRTPLGSAAEQPSEGFPSARSPDDVGPAHPVEVDDGHDAFPPPRPWWHDAVIYQVYPRSFQDADGDGVGNLAGIVRRLDYLTWLGVDAIWLSPIFPSPLVDFGYDVSDSTAVDPVYGTLDDLDRLLAEAHARGLRSILDLVPSHTSDRHPWFLASRGSRGDPKRDWYLWRDPAPDGGPPNNWLSHFGGSPWEHDPRAGQSYLHGFVPEQPDLNWRNPEVMDAMAAIMRFWLDRGVLGRAPGAVLRRRRRAAPGARLLAHDAAVGELGDRRSPHALRRSAAPGCLPHVRDRQPRSLSGRLAHRPGAGGQWVLPVEGDVVGFLRQDGDPRVWVALNRGSREAELATPVAVGDAIVLSTGLDREGQPVGRSLRLRGDEGCVVACGGD